MLQLKLFGHFEICGVSPPPDLLNVKLRGLLGYLALCKDGAETRERLTELLWGSRFEKQAQQSLRQALARLRRALGSETILVNGQFLKLPPTSIMTDVASFESLIRNGSKEALREAVSVADGELLAGIDIREPAWEDWLASERRHFGRLFSDVSLALGEIEYNDGEAAAALVRAEAIVRRDRLREDGHRLIMRSLAKLGRRTDALKHFKEFSELLRKELDTTAEAATVECWESIREGANGIPGLPHLRSSGFERDQDLVSAKQSIVVLPFANLSSDPEHEFFVDGLTEDLITDLSQAASLFVIARNSSFSYKGKSVDVRTIARDLGVRFVLEGSARRSGGRIRINVQLVDAVAGGQVWAERFDRSLGEIFTLQDEVAARIMEALVGRLVRGPEHERKRAKNLEAYDLCARGRGLVLESPEGTREARLLFKRAIAIDPEFSEAHRWLALSYDITRTYAGEPDHPNRELALAAAQRAVDLDPNDAAGHAVLGTILEQFRRWDEAETEFATALKLDPNNADSWALLSELFVLKGLPIEAIDAIEKALRLNPYPPGWYHWFLGQAQYLNCQYEPAVRTLRREATYRTESRRTLAASLAQMGRLEEARDEADLFMTSRPNFTISHWAYSVPFASEAACAHFVDGYRKAGLPE
jgi:TolB-like protein